jgi:nitrile hydratase subunit beta
VNGVHDLGGMQGFGPVTPEKNEPVFHAGWEGRVVAIRRALIAVGKLPASIRLGVESLTAAEYFSESYYQHWYASIVRSLLQNGAVTPEEIASGKPAKGSARFGTAVKAADAVKFPFRVPQGMLKIDVPRRFAEGTKVRARNINPPGHTRLPRYVRGHVGTVVANRGVQAFPDTSVYGRGQNPQPVYSVRFAARELWGDAAGSNDSVHLDLWEGYLEPA